MKTTTFWGYRRPNGSCGVRNHLLILPTSVCSSEVARRIAAQVPGAVAIPHSNGCCQMGEDYRQTVRTLIGFGVHPNVGAVLVVALGCEGIQPEDAVSYTHLDVYKRQAGVCAPTLRFE